jgi:hypothetical protein
MVFTTHQQLIKPQNPEGECSASVAKWIFQKKNVSVPVAVKCTSTQDLRLSCDTCLLEEI